jgi:DNA-binding LacI/PurR family transcriptional regulator
MIFEEESSRTTHQSILVDLRGRIVTGKLVPGTRLPKRTDLERHFGVSMPTVQKALDVLMRDGFVRSVRGEGTFVTPNPPHLCNYGLVFPSAYSRTRATSKFWTALERVAREIGTDESSSSTSKTGVSPRVSVYFGGEGRVDSPEYLELLAAVRNHRVAGLIYSSSPLTMYGKPLFPDFGSIPQVAFGAEQPDPSVPMVSLDHATFMSRALDLLASHGRRRVAMFHVPLHPAHRIELDALEGGLSERGMMTKPYWNQPCSYAFEASRAHAHLLGRLPANDRPDALIIRDDNLEEHVLAGLLAAGVDVGREIEVIAHCNFPTLSPRVAPARRLGFDCRDLLRKAMHLIDVQRRGDEPVPPRTLVPALFEEELISEGVI